MKEPGFIANEQQIRDMLISVGLTDTEAYLYIAGLEQDSISVQELGAATGIKRPTIYHALQTLAEKGLVAECERSGKSAFRMETPGKLMGWIAQQKDALTLKEDAVQSLVSRLATRTPVAGGEVQSTRYADTKSVQSVFDLAFYARSKRCVIVVPSKEFLSGFGLEEKCRDAEQRDIFVSLIVKKNISAALLIYDDSVVLLQDASDATVIISPSFATLLSNLF